MLVVVIGFVLLCYWFVGFYVCLVCYGLIWVVVGLVVVMLCVLVCSRVYSLYVLYVCVVLMLFVLYWCVFVGIRLSV